MISRKIFIEEKIAGEMMFQIHAPESDYLFITASQIPNAGKGLFTAIQIEQLEIVSVFKGKILTKKEVLRRIAENDDMYFMNMPDGSIMDCKNAKCFAKYANDAEGLTKTRFKNNCLITINDADEVCLVAMKKIKAGEELFCSYGSNYWSRFHKK